jgi:DNA-directed RNA polymerase specialized sigma24 family protein
MERRGDAEGVGNRMSDRMLVHGMRRHDRRALREFFIRFHPPLLDHAARLGVPPDVRDEWVTEFLDDVALRLMEPRGEVPEHLLRYLVTGLRHRVANRGRSDRRRRAAHAAAVAEGEELPEQPVPSASSQDALRASRGPELEESELSPGRRRIAELIDAEVTEDERKLLAWLAQRVGAGEIAARLGLTRNAAKARIRRLRRRLCQVAIRQALAGTGGREVLDFFRELDRLEPADRALLFGDEPPPPPKVA